MEVVYLKDFDNKRMYINKKYKGQYEEEEYDIGYFDEGDTNSEIPQVTNYSKVTLHIGDIDFELLYNNKWLSTHPNGLLGVTYPIGMRIEGTGSYAVDENRRYYTAWHVGMICITSTYSIPNVPMKLYHRERLTSVRFKPSIYTPSAWLRKRNLYEIEYDVIEIIPSSYNSLLTEPPGKLLGVVSMGLAIRGEFYTGCARIPGIKVRRDMEVETIGHTTGDLYGKVVSTRAESLVRLRGDVFVLNKNLFLVTNGTLPGDSGAGCYLTGIR
jgi:hypothetical protein